MAIDAWAFRLRGPGGEPIDLERLIASHGFVELPPMKLDQASTTLTMTLAVPEGARTVRVGPGRKGSGRVEVIGRPASERQWESIRSTLRRVLRLDEDLSPFYAAVAGVPDLAWIATGAGRMIQSPSVFEDVVKTICTTNCTWSATERMVGAIVEHLGTRAPGAPAEGAQGRAFPTPEAMAGAGVRFYRNVARAGYRGDYLIRLARDVARGRLDLEELTDPALSDDEVEERLLALPGVGPYATAHVMMTIGRYHRLILDSWTRPTYAKILGRKSVTDAAIVRRYRSFGPYAGLAFWLFLTRDWVQEAGPVTTAT
jgi:3-methyladenine DNA glycosylase/8-oxoguanine DNA glycosylase